MSRKNNNEVTRIVTVELTIIDRDVAEDLSDLMSDDDLKKSIRVRAKNLLGVDDAVVTKVQSFMSSRPAKKKKAN